MKVAKYIDDRIKNMLNNPLSTQGYPKTAQGNPCTITDPSVTPVSPIVYGNSAEGMEGVGDLVTDENDVNYGKYRVPLRVRGKNLLPIKTSGQGTAYGIRMEYNADGSIHVNSGTSTNTAVYNFMPSKYDGNRFKLNVRGTLTLSMPGGIKNGLYLTLGRNRNGSVTYVDTRLGNVSINVVETDEFVVYIQMAAKIALPETTLYPQIELNTTATPWESYFKPQIVNVYLDEPLRKAGEYADYIDWGKGAIKRFASETPTETPIVLPKLPIQPHFTNYISVDAAIKGNLTVNYHSFTREE